MKRKQRTEKGENISSILWSVIESHCNEDELYTSYFKRELWSFEEFAILMYGITPRQYKDLLEDKTNSISKQSFKAIKSIHKLYKKLLKLIKKESLKNVRVSDNDLCWSPWKFLKWLGENQIAIRRKFFHALPLSLMELYLEEFQPANVVLKTLPQWRRKYHETLYQQHALSLAESRVRSMTFEEIYQHPHMEYVRRSFRDQKGRPVKYQKSTIIKGWLARAFPKKRGRPKKISKIEQSSAKINAMSSPLFA